jgi:hypothetical protein
MIIVFYTFHTLNFGIRLIDDKLSQNIKFKI